MSAPLVSVVTPFHNTAAYLAQCIESVLAQSYVHFEYVLVDNCSNDGSGEIARAYAERDPRIRLVRWPALLSQVQNYNAALARISPDAAYCKIVQADDTIFPECLALMVTAFAASPSIGLVSSYYLKGDRLMGARMPYPSPLVKGAEMARFYLRTGIFVFGSPTTVCYRASIVRSATPFFEEGRLHEDTEKCMQILAQWDFAFVHQVLSFLRVDNVSISGSVRDFEPEMLDGYIVVRRYASTFLSEDEASALREQARRDYYAVLARAVLKRKGAPFWRYQHKGLATIGETLDKPYLAVAVARTLLWLASNPGRAVRAVARRLRGRPSRGALRLSAPPAAWPEADSQGTAEDSPTMIASGGRGPAQTMERK